MSHDYIVLSIGLPIIDWGIANRKPGSTSEWEVTSGGQNVSQSAIFLGRKRQQNVHQNTVLIVILCYSGKTMAKILMFNFKGDRNARSLVEPLVV